MSYRIVIADDEALICMDLKEMLEERGHVVVAEAADGVQALEAVRRERPDLVFLDVKMPRLDGIHTAKLIHGEKLAPVILLTAYSQPDIVDEAAKSGVFAYLVKPVNPANLYPAMEVAVSQFRSQRQKDEESFRLREEKQLLKLSARAKEILVKRYGITEGEAQRRLQQYCMKRGISMKKAATDLIRAETNKNKS